MWRFEVLALVHVFAGLTVWTWVIRNHPPRSKQRARGIGRLRQRRRFVESIGVGSITAVALLAAGIGFVDASGVALSLAVLVVCAQGLLAVAFHQRLGLGHAPGAPGGRLPSSVEYATTLAHAGSAPPRSRGPVRR